MSEPFRYTGQFCTITFNGQVISTDYTECKVKETARREEKTAGNDLFASYIYTIREGTWTLKVMDTARERAWAARSMKPGTIGILAVYPKGIVTGEPIRMFKVGIDSVDSDLKNDKASEVSIAGVIQGEPIADQGVIFA